MAREQSQAGARGKKEQAKERGLLRYADGATRTAACAATKISGCEQCTEMHRCLGGCLDLVALMGALAGGCLGWWVPSVGAFGGCLGGAFGGCLGGAAGWWVGALVGDLVRALVGALVVLVVGALVGAFGGCFRWPWPWS
jgi:hypothetical protein